MFGKIGVGTAERLRTEKTVRGGKRRGMCGFDDLMLLPVDEIPLRFCIVAPQYKDEVLFFVGKRADDRIGKLLPAFALVRARGAGSHRKGRVQEQHALRGPSLQIPFSVDQLLSQITFDLLKNILQGWRQRDA